MTSLRAPLAALGLAMAFMAAGSRAAYGQAMSVGAPRTLVVGTPPGGARVDRVDAARSGRAPADLPSSGLRVDWRVPLGMLVEQAPLVDADGRIYLIGARGEVVAMGRDGTERWRVLTGAGQPGPPALLSDNSVVFVDAAGEAISVRGEGVRWRTRFGRGETPCPAPLPLEDGGIVVATPHELAVLDADGHERARTVLREASMAPLVAASGRVLVIAASGVVWSWVPGEAEPTRLASFGGPVDAGAALGDDQTLWAVTAGQGRVTALDLSRGVPWTHAVAQGGVWLGPPAVRRGAVHVVLWMPTKDWAVTFDRSGGEMSRTLLAVRSLGGAPDGGALVGPPHTPPLVDGRGVLAFATADGSIGVASGSERALLTQGCEPPVGGAARAVPPVVGLAPLGSGAFLAACRSGAVMSITGTVSKALPETP